MVWLFVKSIDHLLTQFDVELFFLCIKIYCNTFYVIVCCANFLFCQNFFYLNSFNCFLFFSDLISAM